MVLLRGKNGSVTLISHDAYAYESVAVKQITQWCKTRKQTYLLDKAYQVFGGKYTLPEKLNLPSDKISLEV